VALERYGSARRGESGPSASLITEKGELLKTDQSPKSPSLGEGFVDSIPGVFPSHAAINDWREKSQKIVWGDLVGG